MITALFIIIGIGLVIGIFLEASEQRRLQRMASEVRARGKRA